MLRKKGKERWDGEKERERAGRRKLEINGWDEKRVKTGKNELDGEK